MKKTEEPRLSSDRDDSTKKTPRVIRSSPLKLDRDPIRVLGGQELRSVGGGATSSLQSWSHHTR